VSDKSTLDPQHLEYLEAHAVPGEVAIRFGVRTVRTADELTNGLAHWSKHVPGILFPWKTLSGDIVHQYRPDDPPLGDNGRPLKYLFPKGAGATIGVIREDPDSDLVIFIEGTKQALAAADLVDEGSIYAIAGCRNWSKEGVPSADLEIVDDKRVVLIFDADVASNHDVWDAAKKFTSVLEVEGATSVSYVMIPAGQKAGLDDVLGPRLPERRKTYLNRLIEGASKKLPREPKKPRHTSPFFGEEGLLVKKLAEYIFGQVPLLLTQEDLVAVYRGGVFQIDKTALIGIVGDLLGDDFRRAHRVTVEEYLVGQLAEGGHRAPMHASEPLANVLNGMLDLPTGELKDHDPSYKSTIQFPIEYDPAAECPTYLEWAEKIGIIGQLDDLEEAVSQMLDPSRTPTKAVFLFGPSRSGKSTYIRIMETLVGPENVTGVTLQQLADDRFAAANVYGKTLNAAADLRAADVTDLSVFKLMTGEDVIQANRKFGSQFAFTNRALFMFSANEVPTVTEGSRAYMERIKPFKFGSSYAGAEDASIEEKIKTELPGIFARLVRAWQRRAQRGRWLDTDPEVMEEFETLSNRVLQWVSEEMTVVETDGRTVVEAGELTGIRDLWHSFKLWADGSTMSSKKFKAHLLSIRGVQEVRDAGHNRGVNVIRATNPGKKGKKSTLAPTRGGKTTEKVEVEDDSSLRVGGSGQKLPFLPEDSWTRLRKEL
jgi:putative DNA primase/helicase